MFKDASMFQLGSYITYCGGGGVVDHFVNGEQGQGEWQSNHTGVLLTVMCVCTVSVMIEGLKEERMN